MLSSEGYQKECLHALKKEYFPLFTISLVSYLIVLPIIPIGYDNSLLINLGMQLKC